MKSRPMGINSLLFGICGLAVVLFFPIYKFMPTALVIFGVLALVCGTTAAILSRKEPDKTTLMISFVGIVLSLVLLCLRFVAFNY